MAVSIPASPDLVLLELAAFRRLLHPAEAPLEATARLLRTWLRDRASLLRGLWVWREALPAPLLLGAQPPEADAPPLRWSAVLDSDRSVPVAVLGTTQTTGKLRVALRYGDDVVGAAAVSWSGPATVAEVSRALQAALAPWPVLLAKATGAPGPNPTQTAVAQRQVWQGVREVIGHAGGLRDVMQRVEQVAATDVPVLLLGETGSGKEVVARAVHALSPRSGGAILRVNCGAIAPELIDSELFGHEKGSFTGAVEARKGWFERATGGTLFLDEIAELPLAAQVRLLRVLQDGSYERVGGGKTLHADVRIVAATHRNLAQLVQDGLFRQDLWYRIAVFPIALPALRDRVEDLPELARSFAQAAGERVGVRNLQPTTTDLDLLARYNWPGNVRELAAVIERAAILGQGKRLDIAAALALALPPQPSPMYSGLPLPQGPGPGALPAGGYSPAVGASGLGPSNLRGAMAPTLRDANLTAIDAALRASRGRIEGPGGAADRLGINPHTLRARMRKLDLDWSRYRDQP